MRSMRPSGATSYWGARIRGAAPAICALAALAALSPCVRGGTALAGEGEGAAAVELPVKGYEGITSPEEASLDVPGLVDRWLKVLDGGIDTPQAEIILRRILWFMADSQIPSPEKMLGRIEALAAKPPKRGEVSTLLVVIRAQLLRTLGRHEEAAKAESELGAVRTWAVSGPFGRRADVDLYRSFSPEMDLALSMSAPAAAGSPAWRMSPRADMSGLDCDPTACVRPVEGVSYCLVQVKSPTEQEAYVHLNVPGSWRLWLNGDEIAVADENFDYPPQKVVARFRLGAGWNRLLLKCATGSPVTCRLTDRAAWPLKGLELDSGLALHPQAEGSRPLRYAELPLECALEDYRTAAAKPPGGVEAPGRQASVRAACDHASLAVMLSAMGLHDEAVDAALAACKAWPGSAHMQFIAGRVLAEASHLPDSDRKNRSREAFEKAAAADFVPATVMLARELADDDRIEEALARLKAAAQAKAGSFLLREEMSRLALRQLWRTEARDWMTEAEHLRPDHLAVRELFAEFYAGEGNMSRALAELRERYKSDRSDGSAAALVAALREMGEFDEALKLHREVLSRAGDNVHLRAELARTLDAAGRMEEAAAEWSALSELVPGEADFPQALGDVKMRRGLRDEALAAYDRALRLDPARFALRRYVQSLRGEEADFSKPFPVDLAEELKSVGPPGKYPGSSKVRVLDITTTQVYADGSSSSIVHNAEKILTEDGIKSLSEIQAPGEILEAKVYVPDGTVLEPQALDRGGALTMPGLAVGAVVEWKYRHDARAASRGRVRLGSWFFQSPEFDAPHLFSRYVVVLPKALDASAAKLERNWRREDGTPLGRVPPEERGGFVVCTWTARDMPRIEPEHGMPHREEMLPLVDVATRRTWDDIAYEMVGREYGRVKLTRELREAAAAATKGCGTVREKVHAVYRYVNDLVRNDAGGSTAHEVLVMKSGSREVLMIALLRASGVEATYAYTRARDEYVSNDGFEPACWEAPDEGTFPQSMLCAIDEYGRPIVFDGSNRFLEFGHVPSPFRESPAILPKPTGAVFFTMPGGPSDSEASNSVTELAVSSDRSVRGRRNEECFALAAAGRKDAYEGFDDQTRERIAQRALNSIYPGVEIEKVEYPGLDERETPFSARVVFKAPQFVTPREDSFLCPTGLAKLQLVRRFVAEAKRRMPMKFSSAIVGRDEVKLDFGGSWRAQELPENVTLSGPHGTYSLSFELSAGRVKVLRTYSILPQAMSAQEYSESFIPFLRAVDKAEAAQIRIKAN